MTKGDGSIIEVKRHDGTSYNPKHWRIRLDLGSDPITGKRRVKSRTVEGTKTYARKVRDELRHEIEQGINPDADKITFREMANDYIRARREAGNVKKDVVDREEARLEVACDLIGDVPIKSIDALTIEKLIPAIREHRLTHDKKKCGNTTLHHYYKAVNAVFKRAVKYDVILRNPCDKVDNVPHDDPVERQSLTEAEAQRLLECLDESEELAYRDMAEKEARQIAWGVDTYDRSYLLGMKDISNIIGVRIGLATGMRLGEVLSLRWADLTDNVITVHRNTTKTDAGIRRIRVNDEETVCHLLDWKEYQAELLASIGVTQTEQTHIVCTGTGSGTDGNNFRHWWDKWKAAHGFPDLLFHELRHTQATLLLGNFIDIKTVQKRLGHAKASTTLDFYAHAIPDNDQAAADLIAAITSGKKKARIIKLKSA